MLLLRVFVTCVHRPASPLFIPKKHGVDKETQVEGDLFDFDFEVEPILEVVVGKTLEQALMEVLEEEELAAIRAHEQQVTPLPLPNPRCACTSPRFCLTLAPPPPPPQFDQMRAAELAEAQRLEEAERRRQEEKQARLQQERKRLAGETEVAVKVAARGYASRFVADVVDEVFDELHGQGFFYNPVVRAVQVEVLPWLLKGVNSSVAAAAEAEGLLQSFVAAVPAAQAAKEKASRDKEAAVQQEKDRIAAEVCVCLLSSARAACATHVSLFLLQAAAAVAAAAEAAAAEAAAAAAAAASAEGGDAPPAAEGE